ncbi:MAG: TylF/MycF/NovP-related O-methyltransferase [Pseudomonadota bacterium]
MTKKNLFNFDTNEAYHYENGFFITSDKRRLAKTIAHYELYKSIVDLPGAVIECGVYKGASLIRFATFRDMLESSGARQIIGFDAFGSFPVPEGADDSDKAFIEDFESKGGEGISREELEAVLAHKGFDHHQLIKGDLLETVPEYLKAHPELKVALLHIDVDVYEPTLKALEHFFPHMISGGLVVLDDYHLVDGATRAVDEFIAEHQPGTLLQKLPFAHTPTYFHKD